MFGIVLAALHQPGELLRHRVLQHGKLVLDLKAVGFELVFERLRHHPQLRLGVALERIEREARGCVQGREALLQPRLEHAKGGQQLGTAVARFGHRLRQTLIDRVAQPLQRGLRGLGEAAQLLAHAIQRAIVLGHGQLGGLGGALQCLQAGQPFGRQIHAGATQRQQRERDEHQGQCGQQNEGIGSQGRITMVSIAASAYL